jgi:hypothetical protein
VDVLADPQRQVADEHRLGEHRCNGASAMSYSNIASFQFNLGAGQDTLSVNGASMRAVDGLDDAGSVVVNSGSSLTADQFNEGALVIGGTAGSPAVATIAASDAAGNPLADSAATVASGEGEATLSSEANGSDLAPSRASSTDESGPAPNGNAVAEGGPLAVVVAGNPLESTTTAGNSSLNGIHRIAPPPELQPFDSLSSLARFSLASVTDARANGERPDQRPVANLSPRSLDAIFALDFSADAGHRWLQWAVGDQTPDVDSSIAGSRDDLFESLEADLRSPGVNAWDRA